MKLIMVMGVE